LALADSKGGKDYKNNIKGCIGLDYTIGQELPIDTEPGNKVGPTRQAVVDDNDSLVNQDPSAYWDSSLNGGAGGVAGSKFSVSPRIVPVPLVNPDLMAEVMKGGRDSVPISNIMGFFIEGLSADKKGVVGRLCAIARHESFRRLGDQRGVGISQSDPVGEVGLDAGCGTQHR
jgi:hypothetical protein